jgi:hypothetical protein
MKTPFTPNQFFEIFEKYNSAVYPAQFIFLFLGIVAVIFLHSKGRAKNYFIGGLLSLIWLWIGVIYHISFFTTINKAAYAFGILFIIQGIFFFTELMRNRLHFHFSGKTREYIGYFFIIFGLLIYPVISYFLEGNWSGTIVLGLPCPTTIFTFGFLMMISSKFSRYLLIIPTLWAIIGTGAATSFGVYQDYVMLLAAILGNIYLLKRRKK